MAALEASALAGALRDSVWVYPLVNAGHVAGIALLVGAIVPLDLRLLGLWRSVPLVPLWQVLARMALIGLLLAVGFGLLLFTARATEYVASGFFQAKMAIVALASVNALVMRLLKPAGLARASATTGLPSAGVRIAAGVSLGGWLSVLTLGRLVGYF